MADKEVNVRLNVVPGNAGGAKQLAETGKAADAAAKSVTRLQQEQAKASRGGASSMVQQAQQQREDMMQRMRPMAVREQDRPGARRPPPSVEDRVQMMVERRKMQEQVRDAMNTQRFGGAVGGVMNIAGSRGMMTALAGGALAAHTMSSGAAMINAAQDPYASKEARQRGVMENLPIVGGLVKSFNQLKDAADGTTRRFIIMDREAELHSRRTAIKAAHDQAVMAEKPMIIDAEAGVLAAQIRAAQAANGMLRPGLDENAPRQTVQEERRFQQNVRMLPITAQGEQAEMELNKAKIAARRFQLETGGNVFPMMDADKELARAKRLADRRNADPNATRADMRESGHEVNKALETSNKAIENSLAAQKQYRQSIFQLAQAESGVRQAAIAKEREKLQVLIQQEERIKGAARQFGALNEVQKMEAAQIAQIAKDRGFAALTDEQKGALRNAGAGEWMDKQQEIAGAADPRFKALREMQGEEFDLKKFQKERVKVENKIIVDVQLDQEKLLKDLAEKLKPVQDNIDKLIEKAFENAKLQFKMEQRIRNNAPN